MKHYNPDIDPDADQWIALDEASRIDLVEKYHRREETQPPSPTAHAVVHTVLETQIAMGTEVVIDAIRRLRSQGLSRHEALHAVGSVLAAHMMNLMQNSPEPGTDPNAPYFDAVRRLTAEAWLRSADDASGE
jgi:hypothetical protein